MFITATGTESGLAVIVKSMDQGWRLCLERHSRHYLPFRTMSCTGTPALYLRQNARSGSDIVLTHFHQPHAGEKEFTVKCIIDNRVVLS